MKINFYGFEIRPISAEELSLRIVMLVDGQIPIIPEAVVSMAVKTIGEQMVTKLLTMSKDLTGTPYEQKMKDEKDKAFYKWMKGYVADYCSQQGWEPNLPEF